MASTSSSTLPRDARKTATSAAIPASRSPSSIPKIPYRYLEIRGRVVEITEEGADEQHQQAGQKISGRRQVSLRAAQRNPRALQDQARAHHGDGLVRASIFKCVARPRSRKELPSRCEVVHRGHLALAQACVQTAEEIGTLRTYNLCFLGFGNVNRTWSACSKTAQKNCAIATASPTASPESPRAAWDGLPIPTAWIYDVAELSRIGSGRARLPSCRCEPTTAGLQPLRDADGARPAIEATSATGSPPPKPTSSSKPPPST